MSELRTRVLSAVVALPIVAGAVYVGGLALALLLAALGAVGAREVYSLAEKASARPVKPIGIPLAAALPMFVHADRLGWIARPVTLAAVVFVVLLGAVLFLRRTDEGPLGTMAVTMFGVLYASGLLAFGYLLRHHSWSVSAASGTALIGLPLVTTWFADTGAYAVGKALGKTKLMPSVSPGKTRAGAVAAVASAIVAAVVYDVLVLRPYAQLSLGWNGAVVFAVAVSVAGQIGDLVESLLKREAQVKDSGRFLPGHGGVLDRVDSLLFAFPVAYLLLGALAMPALRS